MLDLLVFLQHIHPEFSKLALKPEAVQKSESTLIMIGCMWPVLAFATSSTERRWDILCPPLEIRTGFQVLSEIFLEIRHDNFSMRITKKYGDKGSPCRRPRAEENEGSLHPFHRRVREDAWTHAKHNQVYCFMW